MPVVDIEKIIAAYPGLDNLFAVYAKADEGIRLFGEAFGVACPWGCYECCKTSSENIEASVFETLPVAIYLYQSGLAEEYLERIARNESGAPCVMIAEDEAKMKRSGCSVYPLRPLICRIFGFSAVLDKHGVKKASICRLIADREPGLREKINTSINDIESIPVNSRIAMEASGINPALGEKRYGINEAIARAIGYIGYRLDRAGG